MKKNILTLIVTLLTFSSAFAEREISRLQTIETQSCENSELQRTIQQTVNAVIFADQNLTVLEEGLQITSEQKKMGLHAEVLAVKPSQETLEKYTKTVERAEADAQESRVGITLPMKYYIVYLVKNIAGQRQDAGRIVTEITCRIEKVKAENGDDKILHTAQLVSFDVKAKGR